jgi:hypothetical protein
MYFAMTMRTHATTVVPKGMEKALTNLYKEYYIFVNGFIAFGLLTGVLAFIVLFLQLAQVGSNPYARIFILREMLVVGISTALLGGFPLMIVLYYAMFS